MKSELWVTAGGLFAAAFAVFHLFFWKLFRWNTDLAKLTSLNRAIVQVLNLSLTFVFVIFAYLAFAHSAEVLSTALGRALLFSIAALWYLRAIEQIVFFGLRSRLSMMFFVIFLLGGSLNALALL